VVKLNLPQAPSQAPFKKPVRLLPPVFIPLFAGALSSLLSFLPSFRPLRSGAASRGASALLSLVGAVLRCRYNKCHISVGERSVDRVLWCHTREKCYDCHLSVVTVPTPSKRDLNKKNQTAEGERLKKSYGRSET
jgi:hypothetical protein